MIPFLHLGPLTIPTFGLMVATGLLAAAYLLQADFDRRREQFLRRGYLKGSGQPGHHDEGFLIIGIAGLAGLVGARLYHVLESPASWWPIRHCSSAVLDSRGSEAFLVDLWRFFSSRVDLGFRRWNSWTCAPRQQRLATPSGALAVCSPAMAITAGPRRGHGLGGWLSLTGWFPQPKPAFNGAGQLTVAFTRPPFMNFLSGW